jgi:hypothetical protein
MNSFLRGRMFFYAKRNGRIALLLNEGGIHERTMRGTPTPPNEAYSLMKKGHLSIISLKLKAPVLFFTPIRYKRVNLHDCLRFAMPV